MDLRHVQLAVDTKQRLLLLPKHSVESEKGPLGACKRNDTFSLKGDLPQIHGLCLKQHHHVVALRISSDNVGWCAKGLLSMNCVAEVASGYRWI